MKILPNHPLGLHDFHFIQLREMNYGFNDGQAEYDRCNTFTRVSPNPSEMTANAFYIVHANIIGWIYSPRVRTLPTKATHQTPLQRLC